MGATLQLTNSVSDASFEAVEAAANTAGQTMRRFAWISDKTKDERARLHSITPKLWCLDGEEQRMSLLDTPGHRSCSLMTIACMSMADAALVVVSARRGGFEEGIASDGRCPQHKNWFCLLNASRAHLWRLSSAVQAARACICWQRTPSASRA